VLAQVLYGLSLRHGWGTTANAAEGLRYLQLAASNSAAIEAAALSQTQKNKLGLSQNKASGTGSAKGELVLAIFELANCFRYGWGVEKDAVAARTYYETAANLGDADACEEAGWCWENGFGGRKGRFEAAQYYRRAEGLGKKAVGMSWVWKEKYNSQPS